MDAAFKFQPGEGTFSLNEHAALLHAAQLRLAEVHGLAPPPSGLGIHGIHPQQRTGKECALLSAHAASDLQDHIPVIIGVFRQQQQRQLPLQPFTFRPGGGKLLLSQFPQIRVVKQLLCVRPGCLRRPPGVIGRHDRLQLLQFPGHVPQTHCITIDAGIRQLGLKVLIPQGDLL